MTVDESLRSLSLDYLNLLINGQAFSDVTFSVEGRLVHAHRCILTARSLFFRKFFCGPDPPPGIDPSGSKMGRDGPSPRGDAATVIPVNSVGYEVFLLMLQFLYSGQVSIVPPKHEPRFNCGERGCWHTHCTSAVDLALDTLAAARSFGVEQLAFLTQKQLASMVEKASIEDVMKVLIASRKQEMQQLWTACSRLVAKSGLPSEVLAKHLPFDVVAKIEELRHKSSLSRRSNSLMHHHYQHQHDHLDFDQDHRIRRMRRALDSSDVELVKLMVMGEGLNLDQALALHYAVENCTREVVKALLELGAADVNHPAGPAGKTPLHVASEMVSPDMVAVLLDHHADPMVRTVEGVTPLDILRTLTSDFLFKGAVPGLANIEPNKLRLCLELVQSAALVISREEAEAASAANVASSALPVNSYPPNAGEEHNVDGCSVGDGVTNIDPRMVYLNLGASVGSSYDQMDSTIHAEDESRRSSRNGRRERMNRHGSTHGGCDPSAMYHYHHRHSHHPNY